MLHKQVIRRSLAQPQNLMDFLTDAYNVSGDGAVPVLALNSLYELMRRYNLESTPTFTASSTCCSRPSCSTLATARASASAMACSSS